MKVAVGLRLNMTTQELAEDQSTRSGKVRGVMEYSSTWMRLSLAQGRQHHVSAAPTQG